MVEEESVDTRAHDMNMNAVDDEDSESEPTLDELDNQLPTTSHDTQPILDVPNINTSVIDDIKK